MKNLDYNFIKDKDEYYLIGVVSSYKEYKLAWYINKIFNISMVKKKNEIIKLVKDQNIEMSYLIYKNNKKYIRLISNKLRKRHAKSHFIPSLPNFDYLIQFSKSFFDENPQIIINKLKSNNIIQFANFVDIKLIKEKYLLYI